LLLVSFTAIHENFAFGQINNSTTSGNYLQVLSNTKEEGQHSEVINLPVDQLLFNITPNYDQQGNLASLLIKLKPELTSTYHEIGLFDKPRDTVFIYPSFTQAAYTNNGFYDYYHKKCDLSCLTVPIPTKIIGFQSSSIAGALVLKLLNYPYVKDEDVDKNPDILKQYKRIIVLHNEYVTKKEFDAITNHPDVVYLYPNALYAEVKSDYNTNTITLVRGHGYPDQDIRNGFGWRSDNSRYEYNIECNNWNFYSKSNDTLLNCYPEYRILYDIELLRTLQKSDPTDLLTDISNWLRYPQQNDAVTRVLYDYDISGTQIPTWVTNPANWLLNGKIDEQDFDNIIIYLSEKNIIK
jgi:hypothetical protein